MKKFLAAIVILAVLAPVYGAPVAAPVAPAPAPAVKKAPVAKAKAVVKKKLGAAEAMSKIVTGEAVTKVISLEAAKKPVPPPEVVLKDVTKKDPNYKVIQKAVAEYKVMSAFKDGTFQPKKLVVKKDVIAATKNALSYLEKTYEIPLTEGFYAPPVPPPTKEAVVTKPATKEVLTKLTTQEAAKLAKAAAVKKAVKKPVVKKAAVKKAVVPKIVPANRADLTEVTFNALKRVMQHCEIPVPTTEAKTVFKDVKATGEALSNLRALVALKLIDVKDVTKKPVPPKPKKVTKTVKGKRIITLVKPTAEAQAIVKEVLLNGQQTLTRLDLAKAEVKFVDTMKALIAKYPPKKVVEAKRLAVVAPLATKYMAIGNAKAYIAGAYGNVMESASQTGNWLGAGGSAIYGNNYDLMGIKGDYEVDGQYRYNQIVYMVPSGGGGIAGGVVNENRVDVDVNTVTPVVNFYGFQGKALLGLKYATLSNSLAPTNFFAINAGIATVMPVMGKEFLGRAFYSLMPGTAAKNPSVLGQPNVLLNYEASTDLKLFDVPLMLGYQGEMMFINGGTYSRYYNMMFLRYNLL